MCRNVCTELKLCRYCNFINSSCVGKNTRNYTQYFLTLVLFTFCTCVFRCLVRIFVSFLVCIVVSCLVRIVVVFLCVLL